MSERYYLHIYSRLPFLRWTNSIFTLWIRQVWHGLWTAVLIYLIHHTPIKYCILLHWIFIALKRIKKNFFPAHSTTEKRETMLTKTDSLKKTTLLITKQQITEQNNTSGIYNMKIMYFWNAMYDIYYRYAFFIFVWFLRRSIEGTKYMTLAIMTLLPYKVHILVGANYLLLFI